MNQYPKSPSWVPVIILLIFFWPVGLYLLYRKLVADTRIRGTKGKGLLTAGWILIVIGASCLTQITKPDAAFAIIMFIAFTAVGIVYIIKAGKVKRELPFNPGYSEPNPQDSRYWSAQNQSENSRPIVTKVVVCRNCGASNTVTEGQAAECEYCGSPIN